MDQSLVENELEEVLEPSGEVAAIVEMVENVVAHKEPSYHPTRWALANTVLDLVDNLSNGRAGQFQKIFSYLLFGGFGAIVNVAVMYIMAHIILASTTISAPIQNIIASVVACEISLIANFIPNDYFTFRYMPGHERPWLVRCGRFHITALSGSVLTTIIEFGFNHFLHIEAYIAEAVAIIIVLFYNFTLHHLFTYNHKKVHAAQQQ
ncbi:MAG TPA: GtrA family protein [Dictyobacter sp.]|jgi:putative flippase GtrA|nr:GtrA family protein [Dictyobacter sp.]